jgi:hypothetical protein
MKIGELFEPVEGAAGTTSPGASAGIRAKRGLTIAGLRGKTATLMPGQIVNAGSMLAGLPGKWIIDHLGDEVPSNWTLA